MVLLLERLHFFLYVLLLFQFADFIECDYLETLHHWNYLRFNVPNYFLSGSNEIKLENSVFTGLEISEDFVFLSVPRLRNGVPATLAYLPRYHSKKVNPILNAYPSWDFHLFGFGYANCSGLISVYRIRQDKCKRLWVLDSGVSDSLDKFQKICPPKILIFNLKNHQLEFSINVPDKVIKTNTLLTNFVIDDNANSCRNIYLYISDTSEPGLIVYQFNKNYFWRIEDKSMMPEKNYSQYIINKDRFTLMDGIIGLAHSVKQGLLYYQALASKKLYAVQTSHLKNWPYSYSTDFPIFLVGEKTSQCVGLAINPLDDTLYFSPLSETSIALWNPTTRENRFVVTSPKKLQFVTEIRVANRDSNNVWFLSTKFQKYFLKTTNFSEINYRIMRITSESYDLTYLNYYLP